MAGAAGVLRAVCEWVQSLCESCWQQTGENLSEQQVHEGKEKQGERAADAIGE